MTLFKTGLIAASLAAATGLGLTLAPTSAEAHGWHHKRHYGYYTYGYRYVYRPRVYVYKHSYRPVWHGYRVYKKW
jgi:hypothetical protein